VPISVLIEGFLTCYTISQALSRSLSKVLLLKFFQNFVDNLLYILLRITFLCCIYLLSLGTSSHLETLSKGLILILQLTWFFSSLAHHFICETHIKALISVWAGRDLNPRTPPCQGGILTKLDHRPVYIHVKSCNSALKTV
jgi:hypothetical protein